MEMHPRPIDLIKKLLGELEVRERFVERENLFSQTSFVRSFACARDFSASKPKRSFFLSRF